MYNSKLQHRSSITNVNCQSPISVPSHEIFIFNPQCPSSVANGHYQLSLSVLSHKCSLSNLGAVMGTKIIEGIPYRRNFPVTVLWMYILDRSDFPDRLDIVCTSYIGGNYNVPDTHIIMDIVAISRVIAVPDITSEGGNPLQNGHQSRHVHLSMEQEFGDGRGIWTKAISVWYYTST